MGSFSVIRGPNDDGVVELSSFFKNSKQFLQRFVHGFQGEQVAVGHGCYVLGCQEGQMCIEEEERGKNGSLVVAGAMALEGFGIGVLSCSNHRSN